VRELNTVAERSIDAPADEVWAYRLDFGNLPSYNADVDNLEQVAMAGPDGTGARYHFELAAAGRSTPVELWVTEAVAGELVAIEMQGALGARERFTVTASPDGDRTRCVASIALTLLVPESIPGAADEGLLATGLAQISGELDRMKEILSATSTAGSPTSTAGRGGQPHG
jgi:uncharacterized membrane protein